MKLLSVRRDLRCFFFIREDCLEKSKRLQIPLQRQHFLLSYFKTLKVCPAGFSWTRDQPLNRSRVLPTELTMRQCCVELHCDTILNLLGRELIWPSHFGATTFGLFGLCPSSLSNTAGFVSLTGKASLVSISDAILFLRSYMFIYLWSCEVRGKSCVGKGAWRPKCHLVLPTLWQLYCMEGEFEQIIMSPRLSFKKNN